MRSKAPRITKFAKMFFIVSFVVLLAGCNTGTSITSGPEVTHAEATQTRASIAHTPNCQPIAEQKLPSGTYSPFNSPATVDINCPSNIKLHIQTDGISCGSRVVLNGLQSFYDSGTMKAINAYINAFTNFTLIEGNQYPPELANQLPSLPNALQVIPAGGISCTGNYAVTNTGGQSIQIESMGISLAGSIEKNTTAHQLIDACSFPDQTVKCGCLPCGSGGGCPTTVRLVVDLNNLKDMPKQSLNAPVSSDPGCPAPVIVNPHSLVDILFSVESLSSNVIYQGVKPTIIIGTPNNGNGTTILNLPSSFTSTLTFYDSSLFSCYAYNGQTFIPDFLPENKSLCI